MYYPAGQKFARNHSISYSFSRYSHFFIFRKNQRWPPKVAKIEIFPLGTEYCCTTLRIKNSLEIALSCTLFKVFTLFHFLLNPRWPSKVAKTEIFPLGTEYC